jgi:hypothetical protein
MEAHCKSAAEADAVLHECEQRQAGLVYSVIELANPIEY